MKKVFVLALVIGCLFLTGCSNGNSDVITEIDYSRLEDLIDNKEKFILEVIQTGCSHCEEFSPRFKAVLKTNDLTAYSLNLYNLTEGEEEKFDEIASVSGTPTVLFFEDGKEVKDYRISGAVSNSLIEMHLENAGYKIND